MPPHLSPLNLAFPPLFAPRDSDAAWGGAGAFDRRRFLKLFGMASAATMINVATAPNAQAAITVYPSTTIPSGAGLVRIYRKYLIRLVSHTLIAKETTDISWGGGKTLSVQHTPSFGSPVAGSQLKTPKLLTVFENKLFKWRFYVNIDTSAFDDLADNNYTLETPAIDVQTSLMSSTPSNIQTTGWRTSYQLALNESILFIKPTLQTSGPGTPPVINFSNWPGSTNASFDDGRMLNATNEVATNMFIKPCEYVRVKSGWLTPLHDPSGGNITLTGGVVSFPKTGMIIPFGSVNASVTINYTGTPLPGAHRYALKVLEKDYEYKFEIIYRDFIVSSTSGTLQDETDALVKVNRAASILINNEPDSSKHQSELVNWKVLQP